MCSLRVEADLLFVGVKGELGKEAKLTTLAFTVQVNMVIVFTSTDTVS